MSNDIIGPVGGLIGIGIMAYAAKGLIDEMKKQTKNDKRLNVRRAYSSEERVWRMLR